MDIFWIFENFAIFVTFWGVKVTLVWAKSQKSLFLAIFCSYEEVMTVKVVLKRVQM